MKKQITKILLGASILISGNSISQDNLQQKDPFNIESTVGGNLLYPTSQVFRANIFPNPTLISKVKMSWPDWAEVTEIQMIMVETNQVKVLSIEEDQTLITVSNLEEGVYIIRFIRKDELLGTQKLKVSL